MLLNRLPVRGDHASLFYVVMFASIYVVARWTRQTVEAPLLFCLTITIIYTWSALMSTVVYRLSPFHPLASYPGPILWRVSSLRLSHVSFSGRRHLLLDDMHKTYGPFVRIGITSLSNQQHSCVPNKAFITRTKHLVHQYHFQSRHL